MNHKKVGFLRCGLLIVACVFGTSTAYADLVVSVQSVTANPGDLGDTFDLARTDIGSPGVSVAGFNFHIQIADPDITATGVFTSTATATYIFNGNSLLGPEIDNQLSPTVTASDFALGGPTTLNSGDVVGLGESRLTSYPMRRRGFSWCRSLPAVAWRTTLSQIRTAPIFLSLPSPAEQ